MIPSQATIAGYHGKPCSLFSAYDEAAKILVISIEAEYQRRRRDGCMVITNDPDIPRDMLFATDDLKDAIEAYYAMYQGMAMDGKSSKLTFSERAQRANPGNAIEKDGMDANGPRYRIKDDIANAQIAALVTCWYFADRFGTVEKMLSMADSILELEQLHHGVILTI
jgi:hypothetical protein